MSAQTRQGRGILGRLTPLWETDRSLTILLGMLLITIFVVVPLADLGRPGVFLFDGVFVLLLLSGIVAVGRAHPWFRVLGVIAVLTLALRGVALLLRRPETLLSRSAVSLIFCTLLALVIGERVLREGPVDRHRIQGAVAVYLLVGLSFALAYDVVQELVPGAFEFAKRPGATEDLVPRLLYFSFTTLTTVGYGDITAVGPGARSLAMLEALIGQLFPAILIARLVGLSLRD